MLFAEIDLDGRIMGNAPVKLNGKIDPNAETPTFDIDLSLEGAKLVDVNPWLRRFIKVDAGGRLVLDVLGARRRQRSLRGLRKTVSRASEAYERERRNVRTLSKALGSARRIGGEDLRESAREAGRDEVPVRGDIEDPKAGILPAIVNLARNAFVAAFSHSLEDSITLSDRDSTVKVQCPEAEKKSKSKKKQKKNAC